MEKPTTIDREKRGADSGAAPCSAKFLVQRPEYPDWWAGWNEYNLPSWTSHPGYAYLVRFDELVDTLTRLKNHKPIAALYSPNAALCESAGREKAAASGEAQCAPSDSHQQVVGRRINDSKQK